MPLIIYCTAAFISLSDSVSYIIFLFSKGRIPVTKVRISSLKARLHDPILRTRFLVPKTGSRRSDGPISGFRFRGVNVGRSFVVSSHDPIFRTDKES